MPPKKWDDETSEESSSEESAGGPAPVQVRRKFDDEEAEDDDVLESWDAAEDSEVEREKAKKAAEAKAKADAEAAANKKSKAQRIAIHQQRRKELDAEDDSDDEEDEAARRLRLRRTEKESDLKHAEDLLGDVGGVPAGRKAVSKGAAVVLDSKEPTKTVDLGTIPLFNPTTKAQWDLLRETLVPILGANPKRAGYVPFLEEFVKGLAQDLPSDQVKKISSRLTALSNEKMKAEKERKGVKKTKAAKTKTSLVATRVDVPDTAAYDEGAFGDDDFM